MFLHQESYVTQSAHVFPLQIVGVNLEMVSLGRQLGCVCWLAAEHGILLAIIAVSVQHKARCLAAEHGILLAVRCRSASHPLPQSRLPLRMPLRLPLRLPPGSGSRWSSLCWCPAPWAGRPCSSCASPQRCCSSSTTSSSASRGGLGLSGVGGSGWLGGQPLGSGSVVLLPGRLSHWWVAACMDVHHRRLPTLPCPRPLKPNPWQARLPRLPRQPFEHGPVLVQEASAAAAPHQVHPLPLLLPVWLRGEWCVEVILAATNRQTSGCPGRGPHTSACWANAQLSHLACCTCPFDNRSSSCGPSAG